MYCNKLRYIRKEKGLTLEELSEKSGLSSGYLCHLEKGSKKQQKIEKIEKIEKALNKKVIEMFFNEQ